MTVVHLQTAIDQLRRMPGEDDAQVAERLDEAEAWAASVMGRNWNAEWTTETLPKEVRSAILARLSGLYDADKAMLDVAEVLIDRHRDRTLA